MYRPHVFQRSFSLFRRVPASAAIRSAAYDGHSAIRVQRVRLRRRVFTAPRVTGTVVFAIGAWKLVDWLGEEVEDEEETAYKARHGGSGHGVAEEGDDEYDDDDQGDGLLFFPTGFSRPRPRQFYRGSDPEWQTFVDFSTDRPRIIKVRDELVTIVRDLAIKNPRFGMLLGQINPNKGQVWMEVRFPDGPPLEYERPGFELTEDLTFRRTTRPVQELHHKRLASVLMPTSTMATLYLDMKRRLLASWQDFRRYTGLEDNPKPSSGGIVTGLPVPTVTSTRPIQPTSTSNAPALPTQADAKKQVAPPSPSNPALEKLGLSLPDPKQVPTLDLSYFRRMFRRTQPHQNIEPPRGTIVLTGLIEIIGDRAKMTLDVTSVYDPNLGKYIMLQAKVRTVTMYKQTPKGGWQ